MTQYSVHQKRSAIRAHCTSFLLSAFDDA